MTYTPLNAEDIAQLRDIQANIQKVIDEGYVPIRFEFTDRVDTTTGAKFCGCVMGGVARVVFGPEVETWWYDQFHTELRAKYPVTHKYVAYDAVWTHIVSRFNDHANYAQSIRDIDALIEQYGEAVQ